MACATTTVSRCPLRGSALLRARLLTWLIGGHQGALEVVLEGVHLWGAIDVQQCNGPAGVQVASYSFTFPGDEGEQQVHPLQSCLLVTAQHFKITVAAFSVC